MRGERHSAQLEKMGGGEAKKDFNIYEAIMGSLEEDQNKYIHKLMGKVDRSNQTSSKQP